MQTLVTLLGHGGRAKSPGRLKSCVLTRWDRYDCMGMHPPVTAYPLYAKGIGQKIHLNQPMLRDVVTNHTNIDKSLAIFRNCRLKYITF